MSGEGTGTGLLISSSCSVLLHVLRSELGCSAECEGGRPVITQIIPFPSVAAGQVIVIVGPLLIQGGGEETLTELSCSPHTYRVMMLMLMLVLMLMLLMLLC